MTSYLVKLDMEGLKEYILSFGIWGPVVSFLLMILQSVAAPLPAFVITFANAALFGWVYGAILSWTSDNVRKRIYMYMYDWIALQQKLTGHCKSITIKNYFEKIWSGSHS